MSGTEPRFAEGRYGSGPYTFEAGSVLLRDRGARWPLNSTAAALARWGDTRRLRDFIGHLIDFGPFSIKWPIKLPLESLAGTDSASSVTPALAQAALADGPFSDFFGFL